ncbi:uncharacterized protein LOC133773854 [Lepus europaeus]|uniref:uncharacterized protein LOC133773854 n=1 Tax=Lepus europaeus TaxID=9983 RepID=UPI002B47BF13|nr:uncharacterized protein LOC133773854 [Lepus europaeus]
MEEEEEAEHDQATPAEESEAPCGPGVHAPYHQTLWACPEPEYGYHYFFGDTAAAYAGAYATGVSSAVGWGPGSFAGRPYCRAQIVEFSKSEDEVEEAEQDRVAPAAEYHAHYRFQHLDVWYPSDCMHLGWPALVIHLYAAFGFPFHRFCCPALCLKQRCPWPRAVELESTQLEAEEADTSSSGQLCTSEHRVKAQSVSLTIKGPFWMAAPPAKDRPSPYAQAGDLSRNFILSVPWPWFVGSVQQYQLAVKPTMGDETRGQTRDLTRWLDCPAGSSRKPSVCQQNQFLALKQNQMRAMPTIFIGSLLAPRIPPLSGGLLNLNYSFQKNTRWQPLKYIS